MVEFNPEVKETGAPDLTGATKPIERPMADKGIGQIFSTIGEGLKGTGELFKDTVKVLDYSHKQDIEKKGQIGASGIIGEQTTVLEKLASGVGVDIPGMSQGLVGDERAQADLPSDSPLSNLTHKASNLKAARADLSQVDLYYKARAVTLSKELRAEYPGYRDYIDRVMEREFSGQTAANKYVSALHDAFLKQQAALLDENKRDIAMSEEGLKKGWVTPERHERVVAGIPGEAEAMHRDYYNWAKHHADNERERGDLTLNEAQLKNARENSNRVFSKFGDGIVANTLEDKDLTDFFKSAQTNPEDPTLEVRAQRLGIKLSTAIEDARTKLMKEAVRVQPGDESRGLQPWSHMAILQQDGVNKSIEAALKPMHDVLESFTSGKKNYDYASTLSSFMTARNHGFGATLARDENFGPTMAAIEQFKQYPEVLREIAKQWVGPDKIDKMAKGLQDVYKSYSLRFMSPNPPSPLEAIDLGKGDKSPNYNRAIFDTADQLINPNIGPEQKRNLIQAFFSDKNKKEGNDMFADMTPKRAAEYYQKWTTPEYVSVVKALGGDAFRQYQRYMSGAFSNQIFKKDIDDIAETNLSFIPNVKITFNHGTSQFGVDMGGDKSVHQSGKYYTFKTETGQDAYAEYYLNSHLIPLINRVNQGIDGFKNVQDSATPELVNAAVVNALRGSGHDFTAKGTGAEMMWKTFTSVIESLNKDLAEPVEKAKGEKAEKAAKKKNTVEKKAREE